MFYASVRFFDSYRRHELKGGEYTYKAFFPVDIGDIVVVDTSKGFALAQVVGVPNAIPDWEETYWRTIVDIVNLDRWEALEFERVSRGVI